MGRNRFIWRCLRKFSRVLSSFIRTDKETIENLIVVAHRGASGYAPENTIAAFEKAIKLKADYIEFDVQMTKDDILVIIHDPTVDRTTNGTGEVREYTYEELKKLDAGTWFHERFSNQRISTLEEVLRKYSGKVGFLIEIKNPQLYPDLDEKLAGVLRKCNLDISKNNEVIVQSFDFEWLERFHQKVPKISLGLLVKYRVHGISDVQLKDWSYLVQFINPNKALVTKRLIKRIHSYRLKVMPYTVREKKSIKALIDAKVDGIITDYPDFFDKRKGLQ